MSSIYTHRYVFIAPTAVIESVRNLCASLLSGGDAERNSFSRGLSATGTGTPTHWIASGVLDEPTRTALTAVLASGNVPAGVRYWRFDADTEILWATNCEASQARVGASGGVRECLTDAGLKFIMPETP